ncbi:MAG: leucine-rich repeat domain-containing protein, partial [Gammaproteobacteria bacterium]
MTVSQHASSNYSKKFLRNTNRMPDMSRRDAFMQFCESADTSQRHTIKAVATSLDKTMEQADLLKMCEYISIELVDRYTQSGAENNRNLSLKESQISDLSPLSFLQRVTALDLSGNRVVDVTTISHMRRLHEIDLSHNPIKTIAPLATLRQLRLLDLSSTPNLHDLSGMEKLTALTKLELSQG